MDWHVEERLKFRKVEKKSLDGCVCAKAKLNTPLQKKPKLKNQNKQKQQQKPTHQTTKQLDRKPLQLFCIIIKIIDWFEPEGTLKII